MPRREKEWHVLPHEPAAIDFLAREARIAPVIAQLLLNRGVTEPEAAHRYLAASMMHLHPPLSLPGAAEAAERLWKAIQAREKICVFGDYDADGVTGTAILIGLIERLGGVAEFYIPHRLDEGYGLNSEALRTRKQAGVSLFVTVDCGITAVAEAREAKKLGLDLIITDHHEPKAELPDTIIVHPNKPGCDYPFAGLSGSGVAFKLAWAVAQLASGGDKVTPELREFLQDAIGLAALGLVADVVPLRDENRILVRHGLKRLAANPPMGLKALIDVANIKNTVILSEDVSFRLAPRLNAAGRLGCAMLVVELLTTTNPARARELAMALDGFNTQRQTIERRITAQAKEMVEAAGYHDHAAIVLGHVEWHAGVVGIVASRLVDHYGRPVILLALKSGDDLSTGSGRSLPGLPLHEALAECAMLDAFGGHAMAAGVKLRPSHLDGFRQRLCEVARSRFNGDSPAPRLTLDAEVPLAALTLGLLRDLDHLEPYGSENPRPKFLLSRATVDPDLRKVGQGERHINFRLRQGHASLKAIAFGQADRFDELARPGQEFEFAIVPKLNDWQGRKSVQAEVVDFRAC